MNAVRLQSCPARALGRACPEVASFALSATSQTRTLAPCPMAAARTLERVSGGRGVPRRIEIGFSCFGEVGTNLITHFSGRISAVFQHTFPGGATWKNSSRKSCHLSKATLDGGTRRRNTWKTLQVICPRLKRRTGNCSSPFTTSEREPTQS
jgi:hypothetical protein